MNYLSNGRLADYLTFLSNISKDMLLQDDVLNDSLSERKEYIQHANDLLMT